jgi:hypothetical protein
MDHEVWATIVLGIAAIAATLADLSEGLALLRSASPDGA